MELFTKSIEAVRAFLEESPSLREWTWDKEVRWPSGRGRSIVLKDDLGLELGSPEKDSVSCLLWTHDLSAVKNGRITLVGPDFPVSYGESLPFGKVVLAGVTGFDEDNAYDRHKELDFLRYDLDLDGFMMRAVSQYMREWCRISCDALAQGFSARILGGELIRLFRRRAYVKAVEVIYVTSSTADVGRLAEITAPAERIITAMNKMAAEFETDCASCDFQEVCDEAEGLKSMRERLSEKKRKAMYG
jgi:CO dehydrogenase/acetyl-CoA synthase beta subunit